MSSYVGELIGNESLPILWTVLLVQQSVILILLSSNALNILTTLEGIFSFTQRTQS
jgi:hypothetical protein